MEAAVTGKVLRLPTRNAPVAPNGVIAMVIFVIAEMMFFAGLISAFTIVRTTALAGWPPPGQPRLPVEETLINSGALVVSAAVLYFAQRRFRRDPSTAKFPLLSAMALGAFFVVFQGFEWVAMLRQGLTMQSSTHGAFFYLIVGTHGLHAVAALIALAYVYLRLVRNSLSQAAFWTAQIFWYFVVGLWPLLYWRVYL
jgi:heme/copper-type cytochrome/quinol oxidase subunit 3